MLQPFELFRREYIPTLIKIKRTYIVAQSYKRGLSPFAIEKQKTPLLLQAYSDPGLAQGHLNVLKTDSFAAIIDLQKPAHKEKLVEMLEDDSAYTLYWAVVNSRDELERKIDANYKDNMRRYIKNKTSWMPRRDDGIYPNVQLIYGELFITFSFEGEERRITLAELEQS